MATEALQTMIVHLRRTGVSFSKQAALFNTINTALIRDLEMDWLYAMVIHESTLDTDLDPWIIITYVALST